MYLEHVVMSRTSLSALMSGGFFSLSSMQLVLYKFITSFGYFVMFYYILDVNITLYSFGFSTLSHFGYICDLAVIALQIYLEIMEYGRISRILNAIRLSWRIIRLCNSHIAIEHDVSERAIKQVDAAETSTRRAKSELQKLETELKREKEARVAVEEMLQNYKDEVDTLNEALKIAAMDIAEVAQGNDDEDIDEEIIVDEEYLGENQFDPEDNENSTYLEEEDDYADAPGSEFDKSSTLESLSHMVREDAKRAPSIVSSNSSMKKSKTSDISTRGATFVVKEDGSYKKQI